MVKVLFNMTWLSIARPGVFKTRFLYLFKAASTNDIDTTKTEGAIRDITESIIGHIAE